MNKDWMDALREKSFSEGATPAPASWEAVGRRVRRAAALRRAGITAAALLPVAALLLWAPWHRPAAPLTVTPGEPLVAQELPAATEPSATLEIPAVPESPVSAGPGVSKAVRPAVPSDVVPEPAVPVFPNPADSDPSNTVSPGASDVVISDPVGELPPSPDPVGPGGVDEVSSVEPFDESVFYEDPRPHRARISVGVRAGAGTERGRTEISLASDMRLMTMNYMNAAYTKDVILSNAPHDGLNNTISYFSDDYLRYYSASPQYLDYWESNVATRSSFRHDIPVTVGLSVRLGLTPRIGLESGLEYTYLHSVEIFEQHRLDQRLHFIGIPLRADVRLWSLRSFDVYAGLGGKVEKCFAASLGFVAYNESRLQWSAEAFAGLQCRLGPHTCFYFQPELSYYFTKTDLVTARNENPLGLSLQAGLRFDL
ncbi:MAG: hypothetical protein J6W98_03920 [Bacteroidales bacterium]|nr:hypothetical protein [Bacteroidales bacterium]